VTGIPALCDAEYEAEAESAAMKWEADAAALTALYDALGSARDALGTALGLTQGCPSSSLLTASLNASLAFPLGSPESESLGCILSVIADRTSAVAA